MRSSDFPDDLGGQGDAALHAVAGGAAVLLSYVDAAQRYRFVNRLYEEWFGLSREAILGRHVRDLIGDAAYDVARPHIEAALAGRGGAFEHALSLPARGVRWLAATLAPDAGPEGNVRGFVATVVDVTRHKATEHDLQALTRELEASGRQRAALVERQAQDLARSEETLLEREARLRAILDSAVDGIVTMDASGAVLSFNPAAERLFGYEEREVLGRNVNVLMPAPYRDEHDRYLGSYLGTGQARIIGIGREVEAQRKSGEVFPIHLSVGEARLGARRIFTGIIRDLTARKRLEEQLAQSLKMEAVGRLAGGVAHDFNNILLTILGRSDAALRRTAARHPLRRQLVEIRKAGQRAAALTRQLLAVSRTQVLNPRLVDLNAVLRDTAQMLRRLIGEDVAFRMELDPRLGPVRVDPHQLVQVVLNLVVNARDAMPRGGELLLATGNANADEAALPGDGGPAARLEVRDNGHGMDEQTQARVFEPYFTTKGDKGTGMGLSTVYGIVKQSGGAVRFESRVGQGTTFRVYLPRAEGRPEPIAKARPGRSPRKRGGRVLLVEDDSAARNALEEFLREDGHAVLSAADGNEAERLCREAREPIDVVVTDTVMPRMSGPELVQHLRLLQPGLRAIFMSGHTPETVVQHGDVSGGAAFLQKPFDVESLLGHVRRLVSELPGRGAGSRAPRRGRERPGAGRRSARERTRRSK